jgi:anti-anti-sigma regulatory factor
MEAASMSTHTLLIRDNLTIYNASEQKKLLLAAVAVAETLELDLSPVSEIDTAGVQLLILLKREAQLCGHGLRIVAHSPAVSEALEFFNLTTFFGDPLVIPANSSP